MPMSREELKLKLESLYDMDEKTREEEITKLCEIREDILQDLVEIIKTPYKTIASDHAQMVLKRIGEPAIELVIKDVLLSKNHFIREEAYEFLNHFDKTPVPLLIKAFHDTSDPEIRREITLWLLDQSIEEEWVPLVEEGHVIRILEKIITKEKNERGKRAKRILRRYRDSVICHTLPSFDCSDDLAIIGLLLTMDPDAYVQLFSNQVSIGRIASLLAQGVFDQDEKDEIVSCLEDQGALIIPGLISALDTQYPLFLYPSLANERISSFLEITGKKNQNLLCEALYSVDDVKRIYIADVLGELRAETAVSALSSLLVSENEHLLRAVILSLIKIGSTSENSLLEAISTGNIHIIDFLYWMCMDFKSYIVKRGFTTLIDSVHEAKRQQLQDVNLIGEHRCLDAVLKALETGTSMIGANLQGMDLQDIKFKGRDLSYADFSGCNLTRTNFLQASLKGCTFSGANFFNVNFKEADLSGANFQGCNLKHAFFESANLQGADFKDANLEGADFYGADLREADLRGAILFGTIFEEADLTDARFTIED